MLYYKEILYERLKFLTCSKRNVDLSLSAVGTTHFGLNKMKDTQIQIFVYNILTSGTNELLLDEI